MTCTGHFFMALLRLRGPFIDRKASQSGNALNAGTAGEDGRRVLSAVTVFIAAVAVLGAPRIDARPGPAASEQNVASSKSQYSPDEIFSLLKSRHEWQRSRLDRVSHFRTYKLRNSEGKIMAEETVGVRYEAPDRLTISVSSGSGSQFVRKHVFRPFIDYEVQRVRNRKGDDWPINSENYELRFEGWDRVGSQNCLLVVVDPKHAQKDLFQGKIWIDSKDFAIVKIAGHLAKSPSFWIKQVDFERDYVKIGEYWLMGHESAVSTVRVFGQKTMTIDYRDYEINGTPEPSGGVDKSHGLQPEL